MYINTLSLFLLITILLSGCASGKRKPFMIIGERNLESGVGMGISLNPKMGFTKFQKTRNFDLNYSTYEVMGLQLGVGAGFNIKRLAFGASLQEGFNYYAKNKEQDDGEVKHLERFRSRQTRGVIWTRYYYKVTGDWKAYSIEFAYNFYNKAKFYNLPSGREPSFSSNNFNLNYNFYAKRFHFRAGIKVGDLSEIGYLLGIALDASRNLSVGIAANRMNYGHQLVYDEIILSIDFFTNIF